MNVQHRILPGLVLLLIHPVAAPATADADDVDASAVAGQLLDLAAARGGLIVHVGCGDGRVTAALHAGHQYLVHGLDTDATNVAKAREHLQTLGLYGPVSIDRFEGERLPYADNLVNLLVISSPSSVDREEVLRVLAPGGVAVTIATDNGRPATEKLVKPWPAEIDEWTHYLHDASNNAVARDRVVGPPQGYQWIAGPRWARSHDHLSTFSALVSAGGRIFYILDEGPTASVAMPPQWQLVARDAFSGVLLWKRPIGPWEGHLRDFRTGPTELARRLVAHGDRVFVTLGYGQPVSVLDAANGETVRTLQRTDNALEMILHDGVLFAVAADRPPDNIDGAAIPVNPDRLWHWWPVWEETPPEKRLVAIDADTGDVLWEKSDAAIVELLPTTLAASGSRVFVQNYEHVLSLDARTGRELWQAARPISRRRPTWSVPTLVIYDGVVLSGDRAVQGLPPDAPDTERATQWVVNSNGGNAPPGKIIAFSADSGELLWEAPCRECYNSPVDVLVADGLVWSGDLVSKRDPGITVARDVKTGVVKRQRPADQNFFNIVMGHHRCYRNKATEEYLVMGRDGIELIDLDSGQGWGHAWVRGSCQYGVMPCNGLIYSPPHSCACHVESKLNSFNVLASARQQPAPGSASENPQSRLEKGPAYESRRSGDRETLPAASDDWPTYRHDEARSGRTNCPVPAALKSAWDVTLDGGRISSPVVAGGRVFVASIDAHTVHAVDARSGKTQWSFTAGGRVDSPPTISEGLAIFGSADGWIYAVHSAEGQLAWRFRAAPEDRRIVSYEQLESAWPLHGSVLVLDGMVYAVAGRTAFLDGGMVLHRLDAATGQPLSETPITTAALPDVLSSDGRSVFLRHRRFDLLGVEQPADVPHLYSPAGFLDDSWWHRTYWILGTTMRSGWGSWPVSGNQVPAGRLLVVGESAVYGFGRFNQYDRNGSHIGMGKTRHLLYSADRTPDRPPAGKPSQPKRRGAAPASSGVVARWSRTLPLMARAMVLSDRTLFIAGPPDVLSYTDEPNVHPYRLHSMEAIREQQAAFEGQRGGLLLALSADDGSQLAEYRLDAPPHWDGIAAANQRLYMSAGDGRLLCFAGE